MEPTPESVPSLVPVWVCGQCGAQLRPAPGQVVAAIAAHVQAHVASAPRPR